MSNPQKVVMPGFPAEDVLSQNSAEQAFVNSKIADERYTRVGDHTMIGLITLKSGYEVLTSYQFLNAENFDNNVAMEQCRKQASIQIWDLFRFYAKEFDYQMSSGTIDAGEIPIGPMSTPTQVAELQEAKEVLEQNIDTADGLVKEEYEEAGWASMQEMLGVAKSIVNDASVTILDLDTASENLIAAMIALQPIESV